MFTLADVPPHVAEDLVRLRRRLAAVPGKVTDRNLLIGTWNIQAFGDVFDGFGENPGSPKRTLHGLALIAEVVRRFDVVAIQEVKRETTAIRRLLDDFLGADWGLILSDVTAGDKGNKERLAFLYDTRRVQPAGLAGEIVLPPTAAGDPVEQFDRTPYIVSFRAGRERFTLLTAHIRFGDAPEDRLAEVGGLARFTADEIQARARGPMAEERNLVVLGDFNIDARGDNPLFQALVERGLVVPEQLQGLRTTTGASAKFYDQIAWFMGESTLLYAQNAGVVDFVGTVYKQLHANQLPSRLSDHFPLWAEFVTDRGDQELVGVLGVDPTAEDPLAVVPD